MQKTSPASKSIYFGYYPQNSNIPQPIEWLILDETEDDYLLLSRYCLHNSYFSVNLELKDYDNHELLWENSVLKQWLNRDFYKQAFSAYEKSLILPVSVQSPCLSSEQSTDCSSHVFILSQEEADFLLPTRVLRRGICTSKAAEGIGKSDPEDIPWWILPRIESGHLQYIHSGSSHTSRQFSFVSYPQTADMDGVQCYWRSRSYNRLGVRPAIRVRKTTGLVPMAFQFSAPDHAVTAFCKKWKEKFKNPDTDPLEVLDHYLADDCRDLGFQMDCGKAFDIRYLCSAVSQQGEGPETFKKFVSTVVDIPLLGSYIYSTWRYYNHWAYDGTEILSPENREKFLTLLNRIQQLAAAGSQKAISFSVGSILDYCGDCIVNPTDCSLSGSGGLDAEIHRAAGPELEKSCRHYGNVCTGSSVMTEGFRLGSRSIIHTVGPVYSKNGSWEEKQKQKLQLQKCYYSALSLCKQKNLHSIAFPSISTGSHGFPAEEAALIALDAIEHWLRCNDDSLQVVIFCRSQEKLQVYENAKAKQCCRYNYHLHTLSDNDYLYKVDHAEYKGYILKDHSYWKYFPSIYSEIDYSSFGTMEILFDDRYPTY